MEQGIEIPAGQPWRRVTDVDIRALFRQETREAEADARRIAEQLPHLSRMSAEPDDWRGWIAEDQPLREAAVLIPLVARNNDLNVLLTERSHKLRNHGGQIAFPGGRIDPDDGGPVAAALRETEEEVGVPPERIEVLGKLDGYITGTGFHVTPVVGFMHPPFEVKPQPEEVADVFEVPLSFLLEPANCARHAREYRGELRHYWAFPYGERYIWGATAAMLRGFVEILREETAAYGVGAAAS